MWKYPLLWSSISLLHLSRYCTDEGMYNPTWEDALWSWAFSLPSWPLGQILDLQQNTLLPHPCSRPHAKHSLPSDTQVLCMGRDKTPCKEGKAWSQGSFSEAVRALFPGGHILSSLTFWLGIYIGLQLEGMWSWDSCHYGAITILFDSHWQEFPLTCVNGN